MGKVNIIRCFFVLYQNKYALDRLRRAFYASSTFKSNWILWLLVFKLGITVGVFLNIHTEFFNKFKKKSLPVYVQCIPSWGIPARATQTKTAETNAERNSIAASLFLHAEHWHLTEIFSLDSNCGWREVLKPLLKTPRALSQQPQSDRKQLLPTIWQSNLKCVFK